LAVASIDSPEKTEVLVFFVDHKIQLSTIRWTSTTTRWGSGSLDNLPRDNIFAHILIARLPLIFGAKSSSIDPVGKRAVNLIAVCQGSSSTTQLYFIQDRRVRGPSYVALSADSHIDMQDSDMEILLDAVEHPGLIAATSDVNTGKVQLFYAARDQDVDKVNGVSQAGIRIVNATLGVGPGNNLKLLTHLST